MSAEKMNRRILFAEFVGWTRDPNRRRADIDYGCWINPFRHKYFKDNELPDPENNDIDCMALARAIRDAGHAVSIMLGQESDVVLIDHRGALACCKDYKQGVCDLAEPIVREAMNETAGTAD